MNTSNEGEALVAVRCGIWAVALAALLCVLGLWKFIELLGAALNALLGGQL
jgi:hypothetical protein